MTTTPASIHTESELDDVLSRPSPQLIETMRALRSPLVILGVGGKMGPSLAWLARRAAQAAGNPLEIIAVSRFSDPLARDWLEKRDISTLSADLLDRDSYARLPDSMNVIYLVGLKFGTTQNPGLTWATNTLAPALACERYANARIVALSSGNVYPLTPVNGSGSVESDPLEPLGEYANSCVARERIFDYFSWKNHTPVALMRLSYAVELRYGVLRDIAQKVYSNQPIHLGNGLFNCIWQGDANEMILRALGLAAAPAFAVNLTGDSWLSTREIALEFGRLMGKQPTLEGAPAASAYLSNVSKMTAHLGSPVTPLTQVLRWTADWVAAGGRSLNKPTHFETRNGKY